MAGLLALAALASPLQGFAQVACNTSVAPLNFGVYDTLAATDNRVNASISLACQLTNPNAAQRIAYTVSLGPGSGSYAQRTMRSGGPDVLGYNVYLQSVSPGSVLGDGTGGTVTASGSITINKNSGLSPSTIPLIGVIPALQPVGAGVYNDTLTVTVTWN
ncbi:MAG TPA: spore coat protein U domain-containing protein [Quisquiliibacterium sp.]|nr:spore coat protein U domain-containing protein [Quisquiliibacterium sp.]